MQRVEPFHHHDRAAEPVGGSAETQRGRVIQRGGREVDAVLGGTEQAGQQPDHGVCGAEVGVREGNLHSLRASGGAGRVQHVLTLDTGSDRLHRLSGQEILERLVTIDMAANAQSELDCRHLISQLGRLCRLVGRRQVGAGATIRDDVGDLWCGQAGADGGVHEAGVMRTPHDRQELQPILQAERNMIARLETRRMEQVGKSAGEVVELGVAH